MSESAPWWLAPRDSWFAVFGYGSLMYEPEGEPLDVLPARLEGHRRGMNMVSRFRGVGIGDGPHPFADLVPDDGMLWGRRFVTDTRYRSLCMGTEPADDAIDGAVLIYDAATRESVIASLDRRENGSMTGSNAGYARSAVKVVVDGRTIDAIAYLSILPHHAYWASMLRLSGAIGCCATQHHGRTIARTRAGSITSSSQWTRSSGSDAAIHRCGRSPRRSSTCGTRPDTGGRFAALQGNRGRAPVRLAVSDAVVMMPSSRPSPAVTYAVLAAGVLAISSSAILVRVSEASGLVTAMYRVAFSALLMSSLLLVPRLREKGGRPPFGATVVGGVLLGAHFWAFMQSLSMTSIASAVLFATTTPVWVALVARWVPGEVPLGAMGWGGVGLALGGGAVITLASGSVGQVTLSGIAVATVAAWLMAGFMVVGRRARATAGLLEFAAGTNGVAAATLLVCALALGEAMSGFPVATWLAFVGMAVLPQMVGHNSLLWALRYLGASVVALVVLLEPVGASILGVFAFGEIPTAPETAGGALLIAGLAAVIRDQRTARPSHEDVSRET